LICEHPVAKSLLAYSPVHCLMLWDRNSIDKAHGKVPKGSSSAKREMGRTSRKECSRPAGVHGQTGGAANDSPDWNFVRIVTAADPWGDFTAISG
jgi:hypothetical protein